MIVVVLTVVPERLRGDLTRWLLEISPGVYVGVASARVRERLWARIVELSATGRAIMVYSARNEQRLQFKVARHHWEPVDLDGVTLMRRPSDDGGAAGRTAPSGWSAAAKRRRFAR
ncbi:type I-E CRISPR-associated endoribonuclease Cas2e [uncultured Aeromicrobium sp.]|uniref:type I-E CRISPR-associated endoribonuclease Cas2e n=1 Tax=uncultured Aeromicrobium sp. TaxID=337820 RepID=UPI0025ECF53F|nr:type I-E CRISPR-associated endoribonuclease Cas2e [uncultured Aeromicrobium sp.]